jgi:hypothetical protein
MVVRALSSTTLCPECGTAVFCVPLIDGSIPYLELDSVPAATVPLEHCVYIDVEVKKAVSASSILLHPADVVFIRHPVVCGGVTQPRRAAANAVLRARWRKNGGA